jgi:hypothetical protein
MLSQMHPVDTSPPDSPKIYFNISYFHLCLLTKVQRWFTDGGSSPGRGWEVFLLTTVSRPALGPTQLPIQWVPGAHSLGVKRPGREADHSLPFSAEIKNAWIYTSIPPYTFMA